MVFWKHQYLMMAKKRQKETEEEDSEELKRLKGVVFCHGKVCKESK